MKKFDFTTVFMIVAWFAAGLFHDFVACAAGVVLCVRLCVLAIRNKQLTLHINLTSVAVACVVLGYALSAFWAVDSGLAVIGFFKFFPVLLLLMVAMQPSFNEDALLSVIPATASLMTAVSAVLMQIPVLRHWFSVAGRLSGFFQYANTFALFLLVALILIGTKQQISKWDFVYIPVLLFGILYSGSRTVFILTVVTVIALILFNSNKTYKLFLLGAAVLVIGGALLFALVTDNLNTIGRFLSVSFTESTFVGRLLYFRDALPIILRHLFGLGYMGYHYYQQTVQSGLYTVMYVHNDFLQLFLDVGWIPALAFVGAVLRSVFKKGTSFRKRLLILIMSAHTCFDFNFQYASMLMLFVLFLDYKDGKTVIIRAGKSFHIAHTVVVSVVCTYMALAFGLAYFNQLTAANRLYPWNTQTHLTMLTRSTGDEMEKLADTILSHNAYVAPAYDAKAKAAYSKGDFRAVIEYSNKAINTSPLTYELYQNYCYMLVNGIYLYEKNNDTFSAEVCKKEMINAVRRLKANPQKLSTFGKMIKDQPQTQLPDKILQYVERLQDEG